MRIKDVCKATGLTDKAVRLYINNQLINPSLKTRLNNTQQELEESSMILTNLNNAYNNSADSLERLCGILSENLEPDNFDILQAIHSIWKK